MEAKLAESADELRRNKESEPSKTEALTREDILEEMEMEKKKSNLVILGINDDGNDQDAVKDLFTVLTGAKGRRAIGSVERIGKSRPGRNRPIRVTMLNTDSK